MTDTPTNPPRMALPAGFNSLTPEQREAMARFAEEVSHAVAAMIDAFEAFGRACIEANARLDELNAEWERANGGPITPDTDGDTPT